MPAAFEQVDPVPGLEENRGAAEQAESLNLLNISLDRGSRQSREEDKPDQDESQELNFSSVYDNKESNRRGIDRQTAREQRLLQESASRHTGAGRLKELSALSNPEIRAQVAGNPNTSPETLEALSHDAEAKVRAQVAANKNTRAEVLARLANDPDESTRAAAAGNPASSPEVLRAMAADNSMLVKAALAGNLNTSPDLLEQLSSSTELSVLQNLAANPGTPASVLGQLAQRGWQEGDQLMLLRLAGNPGVQQLLLSGQASPSLVKIFRGHPQKDLRQAAQSYPNFR